MKGKKLKKNCAERKYVVIKDSEPSREVDYVVDADIF